MGLFGRWWRHTINTAGDILRKVKRRWTCCVTLRLVIISCFDIQVHCHTVILMYRYSAVQGILINRYIIIQLFEHTGILLNRYFDKQVHCHTVILLYRYFAVQGILIYRYIIIQLFCCTGILLYRVLWYTGTLSYSYFVVQVFCCTGYFDKQVHHHTVILLNRYSAVQGTSIYRYIVIQLFCCTGILLYSYNVIQFKNTKVIG